MIRLMFMVIGCRIIVGIILIDGRGFKLGMVFRKLSVVK